MYIIKNALISIKRNKGRNILLGVIILVIAAATTITLAIRNSADTLIESYSNKYDITASISVDRDSMRSNMGAPPSENSDSGSTSSEDREAKMQEMSAAFLSASQITQADVESYADSDYVKSYYYTGALSMNIADVDKVESTSSDFGGGKGGAMGGTSPSSGDFTITGYSSFDAMSDFINGSYSITDGEISDDFTSNTCAINAEFATLNDISVGDTLTLTDPNNEENTYELTVSGIFEDSSESSSQGMSMFTGSANTIITNVTAVNNISALSDDLSVKITPNFVLTSEDSVEKFTNEVSEKGLSEYLKVSTNLDSISNATSSISNTKTFATTFLIVTFVIGGVVLFVINLINIRQRKYEIGVLRTIGMKKSLLSAQFITEILVVAIISLTLGAGSGAMLSVPVSNALLQQEITSSQEEMSNVSQNFGRGDKGAAMGGSMNGVAQVQAFDSIDATVDGKVLVQLFAIGLGLTLLSSSACMVSIQRFSPLTILKERT